MSTMTVIHVKYIEKNVVDDEESGIEVSAVKRAAGSVNESEKELMVNIDCPIGIVLDYIRKIASLEGEEIDLCDETNNQLKNLSSFPGWTMGTEILASNSAYFVVKIERDPESGCISRILPMVNGLKSVKIATDIMSRIRAPRSSAASRNRSTSRTGKINLDKIIAEGNNHQERRNKLGKPASRAKEGQRR